MLAAYRQVARSEAMAEYRHAQTLWLIAQVNSTKQIDPPEIPALLRD